MENMTNIQKYREARAWSVIDLASRARVTEKTIRNLESRATKNPQMRILRSVAQALGVSIKELTQ